jgi:hypothetical protein
VGGRNICLGVICGPYLVLNVRFLEIPYCPLNLTPLILSLERHDSRIAVFVCITVFALGAFLFVVDALNPDTTDPVVLWRALILAVLFLLILQMYAHWVPNISIVGGREASALPWVTDLTSGRQSLGPAIQFSRRI